MLVQFICAELLLCIKSSVYWYARIGRSLHWALLQHICPACYTLAAVLALLFLLSCSLLHGLLKLINYLHIMLHVCWSI